MVTLGLLVFTILTVFCIVQEVRNDGDLWIVGSIFLGMVACAFLIGVISLGVQYSSIYTIDSKIEVYEQENVRIKEDLDIFSSYTVYETPDDEDKWWQEQITLYYENAVKISALQLEKAEFSKTKWLLFFGR